MPIDRQVNTCSSHMMIVDMIVAYVAFFHLQWPGDMMRSKTGSAGDAAFLLETLRQLKTCQPKSVVSKVFV